MNNNIILGHKKNSPQNQFKTTTTIIIIAIVFMHATIHINSKNNQLMNIGHNSFPVFSCCQLMANHVVVRIGFHTFGFW